MAKASREGPPTLGKGDYTRLFPQKQGKEIYIYKLLRFLPLLPQRADGQQHGDRAEGENRAQQRDDALGQRTLRIQPAGEQQMPEHTCADAASDPADTE